MFGIIILPYILGFTSMHLFFKALHKKRILDIELAALLMATVVFTVRGIYTNGPFFWFAIVVILFQQRLLSRPVRVDVRTRQSRLASGLIG